MELHLMYMSSENKLPFMILNPPETSAQKWVSCGAMHFPRKNGFSCGGHIAGNRKRSQEGFRAEKSRMLASIHKNMLQAQSQTSLFFQVAGGTESIHFTG